MKNTTGLWPSMLLVVALAATAVAAPSALADDGTCSALGGGTLATGDRFAGFAESADEPSGRWIHRTAAGDQLVAAITSVVCRIDGGGGPEPPPGTEQNRAFLAGVGTWNGVADFAVEMRLADRGDPGLDEYTILVLTPSGEVAYFSNAILSRGNLQILDD